MERSPQNYIYEKNQSKSHPEKRKRSNKNYSASFTKCVENNQTTPVFPCTNSGYVSNFNNKSKNFKHNEAFIPESFGIYNHQAERKELILKKHTEETSSQTKKRLKTIKNLSDHEYTEFSLINEVESESDAGSVREHYTNKIYIKNISSSSSTAKNEDQYQEEKKNAVVNQEFIQSLKKSIKSILESEDTYSYSSDEAKEITPRKKLNEIDSEFTQIPIKRSPRRINCSDNYIQKHSNDKFSNNLKFTDNNASSPSSKTIPSHGVKCESSDQLFVVSSPFYSPIVGLHKKYWESDSSD